MSAEQDEDSHKHQKQQEEEAEETRRRKVIFDCCKQLQQQWSLEANADGGDLEKKDGSNENGGTIVTTTMLTETLVPCMKELIRRQEERREALEQGQEQEKQLHQDDDEDEYLEALLECLAGFLGTVDTSVNPDEIKEQKNLFVTSGAFEMTMHVLRQFLEDYTTSNGSHSHALKATEKYVQEQDESLSHDDKEPPIIEDSQCTTNSKIPPLVLTVLAHLTWTASDALKTDRVLPVLRLVHECMQTFLSDPTVQGFGCWIMHNLSNPLLQELVAAGSVPIIVSSMKCHPSDPLVQEHGNSALYNLLPLILSSGDNRTDIDRVMFQEVSRLIPSLPGVVLRGMENNATNLSVQQYGLLVLNRICQKDQNTYEVFVSEGGLTILLNNLKMTTTKTFDSKGGAVVDQAVIEKRDCLAQLACQFARDLSRPTNSSMDTVRLIATHGYCETQVALLEFYNSESLSEESISSHSAINIVDPAIACLRNLFCHTENIRQVMADGHDNHHVIPTILHTMDCFHQDPAIQAYGLDVLGRLGQVDSARREITNTSVTSVSIPSGSAFQPASQVDAMVSVLRAMKEHRSHGGVQERAVVLLWMLIVHDNKHASSLISRLREVHNQQQQEPTTRMNTATKDLTTLLRETAVTPRGIDRLRELVFAIEQYEQGKAPVVKGRLPQQEKENTTTRNIRNYLFKGWTKLTGVPGETNGPSLGTPRTQTTAS